MDTTGWYWDRVDNDPVQFPVRPPPNLAPRCWMDIGTPGAAMYREVSGRYFDLPHWTSGDMDMPVFYKINDCQHRPFDASLQCHDQREGHQQPNLYLPPGTPN